MNADGNTCLSRHAIQVTENRCRGSRTIYLARSFPKFFHPDATRSSFRAPTKRTKEWSRKKRIFPRDSQEEREIKEEGKKERKRKIKTIGSTNFLAIFRAPPILQKATACSIVLPHRYLLPWHVAMPWRVWGAVWWRNIGRHALWP